jgi:allantoate deiminase
MDEQLTEMLGCAVRASGFADHRMHSGAGHDAMVMAERMPAAMLFLRSPGGISHHPDEAVLEADVAAALAVALKFVDQLERVHG